jgi:ABC-type Fe3+-hydroxamate transport system substrate-binding protein
MQLQLEEPVSKKVLVLILSLYSNISFSHDRFITVGPHILNIFNELNSIDKVVAATEPFNQKEFPTVKSLGGSSSLNLELIALLSPDYIIYWDDAISKKQLFFLKKKYKVIGFSSPNVQTLMNQYKYVANLVDKSAELKKLYFSDFQDFKKYEQSASSNYFIKLWDDPLFSSNSGFINDFLKKCGGQNILDIYESKKSIMLSLEFLISSNVDVIYSIQHSSKKFLNLIKPSIRSELINLVEYNLSLPRLSILSDINSICH